MNFRKAVAAFTFGAMLASGSVFAHEPTKGPNGGRQVDASPYHAELSSSAMPRARPFPLPASKATPSSSSTASRNASRSSRPTATSSSAPPPSPSLPGWKGAAQLTAPDGKTGQAQY